MDAPVEDLRAIQRKNGKIIIRIMLEMEKVTFESIVQKICEDFNIFIHKASVECAIRNFLRNGYYLGLLDVGENESITISAAIRKSLISFDNSTLCTPQKPNINNKPQKK